MRRVLVRCTVKPGLAAVNERLVQAVHDEPHDAEPDDLRYATFRLDDGLTFVHVAFGGSIGGRNPLLEIRAFQRDREGTTDRCDTAPQAAELKLKAHTACSGADRRSYPLHISLAR